MTREWKPGDVAMVTWSVNADGPFAVVRGEGRWHMLDDLDVGRGDDFLSDPWLFKLDATFRPLVVIDPEDREQVERLWSAWRDLAPEHRLAQDNLQAALREFANPTPPKPVEPTGLGAVVLDAGGNTWVRTHATGYPWHAALDPSDPNCTAARKWLHLDAVEVLSGGVTP